MPSAQVMKPSAVDPRDNAGCSYSAGTEGDDAALPSTSEYLKSLPAENLEPLWSRMDAMVPRAPNPVAKPHVWKFKNTLPLLSTAGRLVSEEQAERRVLMLVNPSMNVIYSAFNAPVSGCILTDFHCAGAPHTTDTIYGGLQLVNPGETAPAHRHMAYACRFIISGQGFTAVEGTRLPLKRGDVVITPSWHWHDHGNESKKPVIWLDALNLPLFTFAKVHFAENYPEKRYPSTSGGSSEWHHPWETTQRALDAMPGLHATYHYETTDGEPLSTTLGVQAERVNVGVTTDVTQDTRSFIYHCYQGQGCSVIESPSGAKEQLDWETADTFVVPAWSKVQHVNRGADAAYLVAIHDGPLLDRLGLRKKE
ncbi:RmlC-like jelly roll fold protein [Metarhizium album ARSEF 1941]|uniref:RmlC-like jelly roll fold protein n=1 Tax=Metarhizium album (strain ARSEF 1941) TaxID=1081103 RepID=A0A0B2WQ43_METAS|nr:RmlC-like jelly roll fold protein [Metarhizium album ARSEF 1941]KHN95612.1 RmlC-like jelly roll fold protein [Metarhizium album ARSEF 1941]